jgi:hypothetical protein
VRKGRGRGRRTEDGEERPRAVADEDDEEALAPDLPLCDAQHARPREREEDGLERDRRDAEDHGSERDRVRNTSLVVHDAWEEEGERSGHGCLLEDEEREEDDADRPCAVVQGVD